MSLLAYEDTTQLANAWLARQQAGSLAISGWLEAELSAALSRKIRTKRLNEAERDMIMHRFQSSMMPGLTMLDIDSRHYRLAAIISQRHDLGIRAADALHLAIAATNGLTLVTFDKSFAAGAATLGYAVELIS